MASDDTAARPPGAPATARVAFCGLGIMGEPMAANLARAGFELSVYNRTKEKAERFAEEHGARAAATPREAADGASVVITMVPDAPEVEEVLLGEQGAVHGLEAGALAIDMSTIAPTAAPRDRPSGSPTTASPSSTRPCPARGRRPRTARSRSWSAARPRTSSARVPLFEAMGERIVHVGPQGHGRWPS